MKLWIEWWFIIFFLLLAACNKPQMGVPPDTQLVHVDEKVGLDGGYIEVTASDDRTPVDKMKFVIEIDGVRKPMDGNRFDLLSLPEGEHTMKVWAVDEDGLEDPSPVSVQVLVDKTRPKIPVVTWKVVDSRLVLETLGYDKLDTVALKVNLPSTSCLFSMGEEMKIPVEKNSGTIPFKVMAVDRVGNTSTPLEYFLNTDLDFPPLIEVEHRKHLSLDTSCIWVNVEDDWDSSPRVIVSVDDEEIPYDVKNGYLRIPSRITQGYHSLLIQAIDDSRNRSYLVREFYYDKTRPPSPSLMRKAGKIGSEVPDGFEGFITLYRVDRFGNLKHVKGHDEKSGTIYTAAFTSISGMNSPLAPFLPVPPEDIIPYNENILAAIMKSMKINVRSVGVPGLNLMIPKGVWLVVPDGVTLMLSGGAKFVVKGVMVVEGSEKEPSIIQGGTILVDGGKLVLKNVRISSSKIILVGTSAISLENATLENSQLDVKAGAIAVMKNMRCEQSKVVLRNLSSVNIEKGNFECLQISNVGNTMILSSYVSGFTVSNMSKVDVSGDSILGNLTVSFMSDVYIMDARFEAGKVEIDDTSKVILENAGGEITEINVNNDSRLIIRDSAFSSRFKLRVYRADLMLYRQKRDYFIMDIGEGARIFEEH